MERSGSQGGQGGAKMQNACKMPRTAIAQGFSRCFFTLFHLEVQVGLPHPSVEGCAAEAEFWVRHDRNVVFHVGLACALASNSNDLKLKHFKAN